MYRLAEIDKLLRFVRIHVRMIHCMKITIMMQQVENHFRFGLKMFYV